MKTTGHGGGLQVSEAEQARLLEGIAEQLYTELAAHIPRDAATPAGDHAAAIAVRICSWMQDRGVRVGLGSERKPLYQRFSSLIILIIVIVGNMSINLLCSHCLLGIATPCRRSSALHWRWGSQNPAT